MIRHTEVDGVPTVIAPASGPMRAGLVFRVGMADETLVSSGITHVVEHLALSGFWLPDYHANGMTGMVNTYFYAQGSPDDVSAFLTGTCDALSSLPIGRLEAEKTIVRTEAARRGPAANDPSVRYGLQDYGLSSSNDWGVDLLQPRQVLEWAADWFTRENAVLWIVGDDVPDGLRLRLPGGVRRPAPPPTSKPPVLPAYYDSGEGQVSMDAVVTRSAAANVLSGVIERRLFRVLRQDLGGSYVATASYEPRDAEHGTITALADALPENQDAVVTGFIEVLLALQAGDVPLADVAAAKAQLTTPLADPGFEADSMIITATDLVNGGPCRTVEELLVEVGTVTPADVHAVAVEAMATTVLHLPTGHEADWAGFAPIPTFASAAVAGTRYSTREPSELSLVIGNTGVSLITPKATITVHYDQCVAMEAWPNGTRELIGTSGLMLPINPDLFAVDPRAMAVIDARVPASVVVWRPALPEPPAAEEIVAEPPRPRQQPALGWLRTGGRAVIWMLFTVWLLFTLYLTVGVLVDDDAPAGVWVAVAVFWFVGWPFKRALFPNLLRLRATP